MNYENFSAQIKKVVSAFKKVDKSKPLRIISHLDADGISACAILSKALSRENYHYNTSIVHQLTNELLAELKKENYQTYIFCDLGSGQLKAISEQLNNKTVFVLDHHIIEKTNLADNINHLNPHDFDIDGSQQISGSGVTFLFTLELNKKNEELARLAIIGAIGDVQENNGFEKLNNKILKIAQENGSISVKQGLNFFGRQTKPLHKLLEYSTDNPIPGVSGSESAAIQFLSEIGINPKNGTIFKKYIDLTEVESKRLTSAILAKRSQLDNPQNIIGNIYKLPREKSGTPFGDAREFATLLNACGRMGKASVGIGACLGDEKLKKKALQGQNDYKAEISSALSWYEQNSNNNKKVFVGSGFIIINCEDEVNPTIVGTLSSILSKGRKLDDGTLVLSLARNFDGTTKVSLRIAGSTDLDLKEIITEIVNVVGGESGGHQNASGALIKTSSEKEFIETAKKILSQVSIEEKIK
ncbi:DHH family phosphoesterase [Candidatus Woesearchaeota archaeon]|nr:DHH family phosphoesterase [Candidatus Woesearchaeota archaeon]